MDAGTTAMTGDGVGGVPTCVEARRVVSERVGSLPTAPTSGMVDEALRSARERARKAAEELRNLEGMFAGGVPLAAPGAGGTTPPRVDVPPRRAPSAYPWMKKFVLEFVREADRTNAEIVKAVEDRYGGTLDPSDLVVTLGHVFGKNPGRLVRADKAPDTVVTYREAGR